MNTDKKELNLNELEQVNGGVIGAAVGLAVACGCLAIAVAKLATNIYRDYKDK